jgi:predicted DNA-binding transcriptional regulator AlpA
MKKTRIKNSDPPELASAPTPSRATRRRHYQMPPGLVARGLAREEAAGYVGISATKFDDMVADGRMPPCREIDGRNVWDRHEVDIAFSALPHATNGWSPDKDADQGDIWGRCET